MCPSAGFYDRRRTFPGEFLLPEELEDRNVIAVAHLLRMNPAFHVIGDATVLGRRGGQAPLPGRPLCPPAVFLDGMPMEYDPETGLRDDGLPTPFTIVKPDPLSAVEIYSGALVPAQFYNHGACGAVVMWTIQGELAPGEPEPTRSGIRRFAMALATAAGLHIMFGG